MEFAKVTAGLSFTCGPNSFSLRSALARAAPGGRDGKRPEA